MRRTTATYYVTAESVGALQPTSGGGGSCLPPSHCIACVAASILLHCAVLAVVLGSCVGGAKDATTPHQVEIAEVSR